jgi:hypothetical protein
MEMKQLFAAVVVGYELGKEITSLMPIMMMPLFHFQKTLLYTLKGSECFVPIERESDVLFRMRLVLG